MYGLTLLAGYLCLMAGSLRISRLMKSRLLEIVKNLTVFECCNDMFILDCGLAFPDMDMPGVDIVIPDFTYVEGNKDKIRGIVITHGHEDHIGALPYVMKQID